MRTPLSQGVGSTMAIVLDGRSLRFSGRLSLTIRMNLADIRVRPFRSSSSLVAAIRGQSLTNTLSPRFALQDTVPRVSSAGSCDSSSQWLQRINRTSAATKSWRPPKPRRDHATGRRRERSIDLRVAPRTNDYVLVKKLVSGIVAAARRGAARSHDQPRRSSSRRAF